MISANDGEWTAAFMDLLLETIVETFDEAGVDLPTRRYITHGTPPADCSQVTVALQQIYLGLPGAPPSEPQNQCASPTSAVLRCEILRPVPGIPEGKLSPPIKDVMSSSRELIKDAELLLAATQKMCGERYDYIGLFADITMPESQGEYGGPVMTVTAAIP